MKILLAAKKGDLQEVKTMAATVVNTKKGKKILQKTFNVAVKYNRPIIVHYLLDHFSSLMVNNEVIKCAIISGNLNLVKLFCSPEDITISIIRTAIINDCSTDILHYLIENTGRKVIRGRSSLLSEIVLRGRFEALKYMLSTLKIGNIGNSLGIILKDSLTFGRYNIAYHITKIIVSMNALLDYSLSKFVCKNATLQIIDCLIGRFESGISREHVIKSAKNNHAEVFQRLLEYVDIFAIGLSISGQKSLIEYAIQGSYQNFVYIFERVDFNKKWLSVLMTIAVNMQNIKVIQFLADRFTIKQKILDRALINAAYTNNIDLLKCLVSVGADISADNYGALNIATHYNRIGGIEYLLQLGSRFDPDVTSIVDSKMNHYEQNIALYILKDRPELRDNIMHVAVRRSLTKIIEYLVSVGIPISDVELDTKYSKKMTQLLVCHGYWFDRLDPYRYIKILDGRHLARINDPIIRRVVLNRSRQYHWPADIIIALQS